jgi:PST family polysaccharide transporter
MSLRAQVVRGGAFLALREGVGLVLRFGGVLALTRILGPTQYGLYAVALSVALLLGTVAQMSVEIRLLRQEQRPERADFDAASSLLVVSSGLVTALSLLLVWTAGRAVLDPGVVAPLSVMLLLLPINVLWAPGQAKLERDLRFKALAWLEIGGDVLLYAVALPLALAGLGVWSAVAGFAAWQVYRLVGSLVLARYRPRWNFSRALAGLQLREGARISAYAWIHRASDAISLVVVQALLGPAVAGNVALAVRLVETLGAVGRITNRIAIVALGRIQSDGARLRRAVEEGLSLQALAAAVAFGGFALVSDVAIEVAFGSSGARPGGCTRTSGRRRSWPRSAPSSRPP